MLSDNRPAPGAHQRNRTRAQWRHFDILLVAAVTAIAAFGVVMVWSATRVQLETAGLSPTSEAKKQAIFVVIGLVAMVVVAAVDYRRLRDWAPAIYGVSVFLLMAVFVAGARVKGSQAWFQIGPYQFEPSELAMIALIVALAAYTAHFKGKLSGKAFVTSLFMTLLPFGLVYKQPDLGTALIMGVILVAMMVIAGARLRHLGILTLIAVLGMTAVVELGVLKAYQQARLTSFVNTPSKVTPQLLASPAGANIYNLVQSKTAISHGGLLGQGIGKGSQTNLSEVPAQSTDFIFSAAGEQVGLVGCALLLGLFLIVVWRTWRAAALSRDLFGTMLCVGVLAMIVFQVFENVGMTMGIMPVAGIPLPWMSYGGSAIVIDFIAVGIVANVRMRRFV